MKIIDLLNKISNGEEVPKKIKYYLCHYDYSCRAFLNDEVEIIEEKEEKKIPEKLENKIDTTFENYNYSERKRLTEMINKINQLIDYLESKGE